MIHTLLRSNQRIALALCALLLSAHALHAAPFVYVANTYDHSVSVIDAATNDVTDTIVIPMVNVIDGIAISPDGRTAYVPCYDGSNGTLQRIDTATNTLLTPIPLGSMIRPDNIAITPNSQFGYVTEKNNGAGEVLLVNLSTNAVVSTVATGLGNPTTIVMAPNGLTVYALDLATAVYPIDVMTNTVGTLTTGNSPTGLAISPDSTYLYVSDQNGSMIDQYNLSGSGRTNLTTPAQSFGYSSIASFVPQALAITPDGKTLYVSNIGVPTAIGAIDISNPASPTPSPTYLATQAPDAMAATPNSQALYATLTGPGTTLAINITSPLAPTLTKSITVGNAPQGLAITPINLLPPASISGCKTRNVFLLQTDYINNITWTAPVSGSPVSYNIYRDAALTELVATVPASGTLQYYDHGRNPNEIYSYYITSVDSNGNQSMVAASVTVTTSC